jgi:hypothetical protein
MMATHTEVVANQARVQKQDTMEMEMTELVKGLATWMEERERSKNPSRVWA